jgi:hypothetical protein
VYEEETCQKCAFTNREIEGKHHKEPIENLEL